MDLYGFEAVSTTGDIDNTHIFYSQNAESFFDSTIEIDTDPLIARYCANLTPGSKIVDIGGGSGRDTKKMEILGYDSTNCDYSGELVALSKERLGVKAVRGDMRDLPFDDAEFDGAFCSASLYHLEKEDVPKALKEANRILEMDGIYCVTVKEGTDQGFDDKGRFFSYYSPEEISGYLKDAGFRVEDLKINSSFDGRQLNWIEIIAKKVRD